MANLDPILDYYVSPTQLLTLAGGSNISLLASNNINFNNNLSLVGSQSLNAKAGNDILVNSSLISDTGNIILNAGRNITINNSLIPFTNGDLKLTSGNSITINTDNFNLGDGTNNSITTNTLNIIPITARDILIGGTAVDNTNTLGISQAELESFFPLSGVQNLNIGSNTNVGNLNIVDNLNFTTTNLDLRTQGDINLNNKSINQWC
jgi:hypothetical protein